MMNGEKYGGSSVAAIQETELGQTIRSGIEQAREQSRPVLVSEVLRLGKTDPLYFFASGRERYFGERFFWKDPEAGFCLAGLGICWRVRSDRGAGRFAQVKDEWKRCTESALVVGDHGVSGTGPTLFGGFSFDPLKEKTGLWSRFGDALFYLPKYMLTARGGEAYLTTNVICSPEDDLSLLAQVHDELRRLLAESRNEPVLTEPTGPDVVEIAPDAWRESVRQVVRDFTGSGLRKVVLARELRLSFADSVQVEAVLAHLLREHGDSFTFAFESEGDCFLGASPERLVKKDGTCVFSTCLAGSIGRGATPEEDERLGNRLLNDPKNLIEHQYVVEMIRSAMQETCDSVILPPKPQLMKMKYIQHLYTPVVGTCRAGTSLLDLVERLHPTPALGGSPRQAAVEKIREVEKLDRGFYAAPLGWMDYRGSGEFAAAIRSGLIQGTRASLFAGSGIVADSVAEDEYLETSIKFRPMLAALGWSGSGGGRRA